MKFPPFLFQSNETFFHNGLKEMDKRLNGLEDSINKLNNKPQPEDVQQSLAELGGKLTEVRLWHSKQTIHFARMSHFAVVLKIEKAV